MQSGKEGGEVQATTSTSRRPIPAAVRGAAARLRRPAAAAAPSAAAPAAVTADGRGRALRHAAATLVVVAVSFSVTAVLANLAARGTGSLTAFAAVQCLIGLPLVVLWVRRRSLSAVRADLRPIPWTLAAAGVAYVVTPASWAGTALFWWRLIDPGVLTLVLDLLVWCAAVALGVLWGSTQKAVATAPSNQYA